MKAMLIAGVLLALAGLYFLAQGGFSFTQNEKVLDIGPLHASADTEKHIGVPPLVAWGMTIGGIVLVVVGAKKRA